MRKKRKDLSRYAAKARSGKQMYGPGCCGHRLTQEQMRRIREKNGTLHGCGLPTRRVYE